MRLRLLPYFACVIVSCLAAAPAASATTETDSLGAVSASLTYTKNRDGFTYRGVSVRISRGGVPALAAPIRGQGPSGYVGSKAVDVVDLDGDGEPEVLLSLYSGGAHCCVSGWVYRFVAGRYVKTEESYGDVGFKLRDLGGTALPEFLTADPVFSYAFASYAESSFPIRVQRFAAGRFVDVTREFPALVRKDLAARKRFLRAVRKRKGNPRGAIAAIAADQYTLGDAKAARATIARGGKAYGPRFARSLGRFLKRHGYVR